MKKNVIFLIVDALIPNRTGYGGNIRSLSPELNRIVKTSLNCTNAFSMGNPTEFALPGLFASSYLLDEGGYAEGISNRKNVLAEVLKREGYSTAAFTPIFRPSSDNYNRGFDDYFNICDPRVILKNFSNTTKWYYEKYQSGQIEEKDCIEALIKSCDSYFYDLIKYCQYWQTHINDPIFPKSIIFHNMDYGLLQKQLENEQNKYCRNKIEYIDYFLKGEELGFAKIVNSAIEQRLRKTSITWADLRYRKIMLKNLFQIWKSSTSYKSGKEVLGLALYRIMQGQQRWTKYPSSGFILEMFKNWMGKQNASTPFYTYIHLLDVHELNHYSYDFVGQEKEKKIELDMLKEVLVNISKSENYEGNVLYDSSIRYVDNVISRLKSFLSKTGKLKDTLIVITSDHGGMFHNLPNRDHISHRLDCFYDELYHVPLIFSDNETRELEYKGLTSSVDIAPTILKMLNIEIPESFRGIAVNAHEPGRDYVIMENQGRGPCNLETKPIRVCVRTSSMKLVYESEPASISSHQFVSELYDLEKDPDEHENLRVNKDSLDKAEPLIKIAKKRIQDISRKTPGN
jgi:arylsulfatase A-like enzyme